MQIVPNYYKNFKCIANKCKNSCCIGWEIDIDSNTLEFYKNISGELGERLKRSICTENEVPYFITDNNDRCPFLNKSGLCDIISELGEDALCQICYDHPRFKNYYGNIEEIGIGLCCEAAAELILSNKNKVAFEILGDEEKKELSLKEEGALFFREKVLNIFQNREKNFNSKIVSAINVFGKAEYTIPHLKDLINTYRNLERLDNKWDEYLNKTEQVLPELSTIFKFADEKLALPTEQLLVYFTYRYLANEIIQNNALGVLIFIFQSIYFCLAVTIGVYGKNADIKDFIDICRMYSAEIEYSEENLEELM